MTKVNQSPSRDQCTTLCWDHPGCIRSWRWARDCQPKQWKPAQQRIGLTGKAKSVHHEIHLPGLTGKAQALCKKEESHWSLYCPDFTILFPPNSSKQLHRILHAIGSTKCFSGQMQWRALDARKTCGTVQGWGSANGHRIISHPWKLPCKSSLIHRNAAQLFCVFWRVLGSGCYGASSPCWSS